jgi:hypothetical protein
MHMAGLYFCAMKWWLFLPALVVGCTFTGDPNALDTADKEEFTEDSTRYQGLYALRRTLSVERDSIEKNVLVLDSRDLFARPEESAILMRVDKQGMALYLGKYLIPGDSLSDYHMVCLFREDTQVDSVLLNNKRISGTAGGFDIPLGDGKVRRLSAYALRDTLFVRPIREPGLLTASGFSDTLTETKSIPFRRYLHLTQHLDTLDKELDFLRERWMGRLK